MPGQRETGAGGGQAVARMPVWGAPPESPRAGAPDSLQSCLTRGFVRRPHTTPLTETSGDQPRDRLTCLAATPESEKEILLKCLREMKLEKHNYSRLTLL